VQKLGIATCEKKLLPGDIGVNKQTNGDGDGAGDRFPGDDDDNSEQRKRRAPRCGSPPPSPHPDTPPTSFSCGSIFPIPERRQKEFQHPGRLLHVKVETAAGQRQ
jgi:hypothetical protein